MPDNALCKPALLQATTAAAPQLKYCTSVPAGAECSPASCLAKHRCSYIHVAFLVAAAAFLQAAVGFLQAAVHLPGRSAAAGFLQAAAHLFRIYTIQPSI
jgi:hypothetical protein